MSGFAHLASLAPLSLYPAGLRQDGGQGGRGGRRDSRVVLLDWLPQPIASCCRQIPGFLGSLSFSSCPSHPCLPRHGHSPFPAISTNRTWSWRYCEHSPWLHLPAGARLLKTRRRTVSVAAVVVVDFRIVTVLRSDLTWNRHQNDERTAGPRTLNIPAG